MCSSGSGTPKANGTQECNCLKGTSTQITVDYAGRGYYEGKYGYLTNKNYHNVKINAFYTEISGGTWIELSENINQSTIIVLVNGKQITFSARCCTNGITSFYSSEKVFKTYKNKTIDLIFLN